MRILLTGGAGFIGSHLAERLLRERHSVLVLDDLSTGAMENVAHLESRPGFALRIGSALDQALMNELMGRSDFCIHLAAAVGVKLIVEHPVHTIHTNVRATEAVLEAAAIDKKPVLVASTSEVYGKSAKVPYGEEDDLCLGATTRSRWAYACSKALDEWLAFAYIREKGVPVIVTRFFNTVGPRQTGRYGMVVPTFVRQALRGEPITIHGDGTQSRCFGHVSDACEAVTRLIASPASRSQVFNIGNDEEVTITELAKIVREEANSRSELRYVPYAEAYADGFEDMQRRVPDVSKLERTIGFRPRIPLRSIVRDVLEFERKELEKERG